MNSAAKTKKLERKLKKLQHTVLRETGMSCDLTPTKNIVICNAGLVNGLSEEAIYKHFSQHGILENILLLPGKSCSFVSYTKLQSACNAFETFNGKLNIAQDNKPVYLLYTSSLPVVETSKTWKNLPPGLLILEDFVTDEEETELLKLCDFEKDSNGMKNRQVKHYGYEFRYDTNNVDKDKPLNEAIPDACNFLWNRLSNTYGLDFHPDQLTVNHYSAGQGIPHHVDTHSAFEDPIVSLSLQSSVVMEFKLDNQHLCVLLPRKSLAVISGESRYDWTHGITPRKFDVVYTNNNFTALERATRTSFTFRKILQGECRCSYKSKCDSYSKQVNASIENDAASRLEKLHVHEVYENIASHFSDTRHKPWPNVLEFVQSFDTGSILVDIGCGNGKYLGQNTSSFSVGCDQSTGLINVCKDRGFEVFTGNCLSVPLRDDIADGVISIAVIHHLANEDRRLQAIKEMVRVLRVGGQALVYVWAKDQCKNEEKSSYIKQDRRNRKCKDITSRDGAVDNEVSVLQGVSLPVHTNRTQFKHNDVLVPWKLKGRSESDNVFLRFYHVFQENELPGMCRELSNVEVVKSYYDQGNWCVILRKV
ncbi:hypothetical protein NQ315_007816 [Exocentrus adspersus]|uniref:tRNA (carboxymethyluridine(34)-5-O)-methyltransferase n=1 Tax=Exocentrus adspersus TaxID=1586481 RepID=A0AAV8WAI0_9CUCU|nr:hypothetical protein NQ315_007816 [Exocentrus adspersus]